MFNKPIAEYIGEYCGCIGFFEHKDDALPVVWLLDKEININIEICEKEDSKTVVLEYTYSSDLDTLF